MTSGGKGAVWILVLLLLGACEEEPEVTTVEITPSSSTIFKGDTLRFWATVEDQNGDIMKNVPVSWLSDNDSVATVDEAGLATGTGRGTATIMAMANGETGIAVLTVELTTEQIVTGSWSTLSGEESIILTTGSDQTAFDSFVQGTGAITVTGGYHIELTYIFGFASEDSGAFFLVSSSPSFYREGSDPSVSSLPGLLIFDIPPWLSLMRFMTVEAPGDTLKFNSSPANYVFDVGAGSLTIPTVTLYDMTGLDSVIIGGNLAYTIVSIPANSPTRISFPLSQVEDDQTTVSFGQGGLYQRISTYLIEGETETEIADGTWELLTDTTVVIIETIQGGGFDEPDTIVVHLTLLTEDVADIWFVEDACEDEDDDPASVEECLENFQTLFWLDEGSLVAVQRHRSFRIQKGGGGALRRLATGPPVPKE